MLIYVCNSLETPNTFNQFDVLLLVCVMLAGGLVLSLIFVCCFVAWLG